VVKVWFGRPCRVLLRLINQKGGSSINFRFRTHSDVCHAVHLYSQAGGFNKNDRLLSPVLIPLRRPTTIRRSIIHGRGAGARRRGAAPPPPLLHLLPARWVLPPPTFAAVVVDASRLLSFHPVFVRRPSPLQHRRRRSSSTSSWDGAAPRCSAAAAAWAGEDPR
jgi:hypothetical protein